MVRGALCTGAVNIMTLNPAHEPGSWSGELSAHEPGCKEQVRNRKE